MAVGSSSRRNRTRSAPQARERETTAPTGAHRAQPLKLSVVVVAHDMDRELPRTVRSLSTAMQRNIEATDYEVIVVDNGSAHPANQDSLREWIPRLRLLSLGSRATASPVPAINRGLELARGELIGVWIDGARLASPGLLAAALRASTMHARPVIGTLAFHLGPDVQMKSVLTGYDQTAEDRLLAECGWEEDGYRLFDVSVLAGSSRRGWYATPDESNAVFLRAAHWRELGGYDPAFVSPGGGFANLDLWVRACDDPTCEVIMLLGEATFHQIHGGVATNARVSRWEEWHTEYRRLRGKPFSSPSRRPLLVGRLGPSAGRHVGTTGGAPQDESPVGGAPAGDT